MKIVVTGGAGYIGSHMTYRLIEEGHDVTIIDNLSCGFRELIHPKAKLVVTDVHDVEGVRKTLTDSSIEAVLHFAAFVKVEESISQPLLYYDNNTFGTTCLLEAIKLSPTVKHFIFSSTAAVYGDTTTDLVKETTATKPITPYGHSKLMAEQILTDFAHSQPTLKYAILRYFNVAGAHPTAGIGPRHENATHLIKVAAETAAGLRESLSIFGTDYPTDDGTCVRDYIHVMDLVEAHRLALAYLVAGNPNDTFNLGYGRGQSVKAVVEMMGQVSHKKLPTVLSPRREGDSASVVADSSKAQKALQWKPQWNDLEKICETAYRWEIKRLQQGKSEWNTASF